MILVHEYIMRLMIEALISLGLGSVFVACVVLLVKKAYEASYAERQVIHGSAQVQTVMDVISMAEISPKQAARMLGVNRKTMDHMMETGEIGYMVSGGRKMLLAKDVLGFCIRRSVRERKAMAGMSFESTHTEA